MPFPYITSITAGVLILLQVLLAFAISGFRGKSNTWLGDGGNAELARTVRRHANLAENAGLFATGFTLLEMSQRSPKLLTGLCVAFVLARLVHAAGLSRQNTNNPLRLMGGLGTYLIGFTLGGALIWTSLT